MALLDQILGSPSDQALFALGSGLLGVRRGNEGRAFQQAMSAYNDAKERDDVKKQRELQQKLIEMQLKDQQQKIADVQAVRDWYSKPENVMSPAKPAVPWGNGNTGSLDQEDVNPGGLMPAAPLSARAMGQRMMASGNPALVQQGFQMMQKTPPIHLKEGESLLDPETFKPLASAPKQKDLPTTIQEYNLAVAQGYKGSITDWMLGQKRAGATNVNVNTGKNLLEKVADSIGEDISGQRLSARGAPEAISNIDRVLNAVSTGKVIAGPGAKGRLVFSQIGQQLGFGDPNSEETIKNTRLVIQGTAETILKNRSSLRGQGQVSDYEGKLLARATSGEIEEMTADEILQVMKIAREKQRWLIRQYNTTAKEIRGNKDASALHPFFTDIPEPGDWAPMGGNAEVDLIRKKHGLGR